jgi:hypothetical protein
LSRFLIAFTINAKTGATGAGKLLSTLAIVFITEIAILKIVI